MDGILAVWKPEGWTSHDVVAKARRLLKMKRIGHAGTLDPMVTGVLPLCLGRATRVVEYMQERPKAYGAVIQLGVATDTEDMTGTVIDSQDASHITKQAIEEALQLFIGEIEQIPPMYSAVKINGKRLYELAREGKTVERKSRRVNIYEIHLTDVQLERDQPQFSFHVTCSKGTYIRTLCVDIGKALGVPAAMAQLTRTMSGGITRESCLTLEQIEQLAESGELENHLISADEAISHMISAVVPAPIGQRALLGQKISFSHTNLDKAEISEGQLIRLYSDDSFLGIFEFHASELVLKPIKVFSP